MKRRFRTHESSLFLLELMIAILFFSMAGAVCTQVFVKARDLSKDAQELSEAAFICSNAAELVLAADSPENAISNLWKEYKIQEETPRKLTVAYGENRVLNVEKWEDQGLYIYNFQCLRGDGSLIYELPLTRFYEEAVTK